MKLLVKQRVFSWTDSYDVYDENENAKYFVKAEFLSLGHRLHVYDMAGNELGLIKEKVMSLLPVFGRHLDGLKSVLHCFDRSMMLSLMDGM